MKKYYDLMRGGVNMRLNNWIKDDRGFSLVEVMLALAILALVTLPIINYFTYSSVQTIDGRERQTATMAAEDIMEELKAYTDHDQIARLVETPDPSATATPAPSMDMYTVKVYNHYTYNTPAPGTSVTENDIKNGLNRVVCVHIEKKASSLSTPAPTSTPAATSAPGSSAAPSATPENKEVWEIDGSPLPDYPVAAGASPEPLDIKRNVVVNDSEYTAKVHFDYDTYDSDTLTKDGTAIWSEYNDYYLPQPSEVYADTNVVAVEDDEIDTAVSEIYTDLMSSASTPGSLSGVITKDIVVEETEIRQDKLKNIFVFYKPAWDSTKTENFKVTFGAGITQNEVEKLSFYLTYQDMSGLEEGETPAPGASPIPGISDSIGDYTIKMNDSPMASYAKFYSNLNRPSYENNSINVDASTSPGFKLQKNSAAKYDSYVSKDRKKRIAKIYVDIFRVNETTFSKENVIAHVESTIAE